MQAGLSEQRATNALSAGYTNMMGTALSGIYNIASIRPAGSSLKNIIIPPLDFGGG